MNYAFQEKRLHVIDPVTAGAIAQNAPGILDGLGNLYGKLFGGVSNLFNAKSNNKTALASQNAQLRAMQNAQDSASFNAQMSNLIKGNKQTYIIIGAVVFVLLVGTFIYFKTKK